MKAHEFLVMEQDLSGDSELFHDISLSLKIQAVPPSTGYLNKICHNESYIRWNC